MLNGDSYGADEIEVLEGLEPIRKRPGMYIGDTGTAGLHQLVWEVVDNAVDESTMGYCDCIDVTLHSDGSCEVSDNGRGIPTDMLEEHGKPAVEVVFTTLHAGGKFNNGSGYRFSGGLHGIGISAVNALSRRVDVEIHRDSKEFKIAFADGGEVAEPLSDGARSQAAQSQAADPHAQNGDIQAFASQNSRTNQSSAAHISQTRETGTTVRFFPDATIFEDITFRAQTIRERLRTMSFLNKGLLIRFRDLRSHRREDTRAELARAEDARADNAKERGDSSQETGGQEAGGPAAGNLEASPAAGPAGTSNGEWVEYYTEDGIVDFVRHLNKAKEPLFPEVGTFAEQTQERELEIAFQWNSGFNADGIHSYANGINTTAGGTHEDGFRRSLTNVINRYARKFNKIKTDEKNLSGEDIHEGLTAIVSVKLVEPQFEGQTKRKLGNGEITQFVREATNKYFTRWLEENPGPANQILEKALLARKARREAEEARRAVRRKSALVRSGLPGKLSDCSSRFPEESELYVVEGDSAGGSARKARDPKTMAILAIRGKILNVERATALRMIRNEEIQSLINAIGANFGEEFEIDKIRYHKIILLCDADVDGSHISILLLTFFFRQMRELVENGHVYIAQPPLYSTMVGKEKRYLKDDADKDAFLKDRPNHKNEFQRLKGLGEMDADELWDTTMDPETRTLLQITVEEATIADEILAQLMGDVVEDRKRFIQENASDVRFLDI